MQILQFFPGEITATKKASVPRTAHNKDPVHWDSAFATDLMWKTGRGHCEGQPCEACGNYNKHAVMINEYGNIQMVPGGP